MPAEQISTKAGTTPLVPTEPSATVCAAAIRPLLATTHGWLPECTRAVRPAAPPQQQRLLRLRRARNNRERSACACLATTPRALSADRLRSMAFPRLPRPQRGLERH